MPTMFSSFSDVEAYVRQDSSGNGKSMLQLQLAMGESLFGGDSAAVAAAWIAYDDVRLAADATARREQEDRDLRSREVNATEAQAASAREATRIAWLALVVSAVGTVIAIVALIKSPGAAESFGLARLHRPEHAERVIAQPRATPA